MGETQQPAERIPLEAIESSNLAAIGYNPAKQIAAVQFKQSGTIFHYAGISLALMQDFYSAESRGRFYANQIRGKFQAERMTGPCGSCGAEGWVGEKCADCGTNTHQAAPRKGEPETTATGAELEERLELIPTRVMISREEATTPARALERGIAPDVIFVRDDGWSLGAPRRLEEAARQTWAGKWVERWVWSEERGRWAKRWPLPGREEAPSHATR